MTTRRRGLSLAAATIPLIILFVGMVALQAWTARAAAITADIERLHARIADVVGSVSSLENVATPSSTATPRTTEPGDTPSPSATDSTTPGSAEDPSDEPDSTSVPERPAPSLEPTNEPDLPSPTPISLAPAGGLSGAATPAEIAASLSDHESAVWVIDRDGRVLVRFEAPSGRPLPADLTGPSAGQREAVLSKGTMIDILKNDWLLVVAPIGTAAGDPVGVVGVAIPVDHVAAATAAGLAFVIPAAIVLLVALAIAFLLASRAGRDAPAPTPASATAPTPAAATNGPPASPATPPADREALVDALIEVRDQVTSVTLGDVLDRALAAAGVQPVSADGEAFDARIHHAVASTPTTDAGLHDRIASTERLGYADGDRLIRAPQVVVYQFTGSQP